MLTNVESLKTLYTKLGGALTDTYPDIAGGIPVGEYELISDCILACSEKSSGGGGGSVTVDDTLKADSQNPVQNKVITAALAAKGDDFPVILTETGGVLSCENATITEIVTAARAIKNVFAIIDDGTGILRMPLVYAMDGLVQFGCTNLDNDGSAWSAVTSGILGKMEAGEDTWTPVGG